MRSLAPLTAAVLCGLVLPAAATADDLVANVGGHVDAAGSHLAYSGPEGKRFRLVIDGRVVPVASAARPFDVDLGTDARGRLVAVYTRPRTRAERDVVVLDVGSGRERRVRGAARPDRDEAAPSVSRGRVVFAVRGKRRDRLASVPLAGGRLRELAVPGGASGEVLVVQDTELAGGVLALTVRRSGEDSQSSELWFSRSGRAPERLFRVQSTVNRVTDLVGLGVSSRWVTTGVDRVEADPGPASPYAVRVSPSRGTVQRASLPDAPTVAVEEEQRKLDGLASSGDRLYTATCLRSVPSCRLVRTDVTWRTSRRSAAARAAHAAHAARAAPAAKAAAVGRWSAPVRLPTDTTVRLSGGATAAAVAVDGTAAFSTRYPTRVAVADRGTPPGPGQRLDPGLPARVAAAPGGRVIAVFAGGRRVVAHLRRGAGRRFGRAIPIAGLRGDDTQPQAHVAMDAGGTATIVWTDRTFRAGGPDVLRTRTVDPAGNLGPVQELASAGDIDTFTPPAVNASGVAAVAWTSGKDANVSDSERIGQLAYRPGRKRALRAC